MNTGLARLLRPRSIAVFGGSQAAEVIRQSDRMGFSGAIWPVHPHHDEVAGHRAYRSVDDLPGIPDAAFLGVNRHVSIDLMAALSQAGAGGVVAHAAGFAEAGKDGLQLQQRLIAAANGMPFLGPNCYGFINYLDNAMLWPDQHGGSQVTSGVGIITQSGNIGLNLSMQMRGLPIAYIITLGNQVSIGLSDAIDALLDDSRVTAIGLHIEAIDNPASFAAAAARAHQLAVPLVALKTGKSVAGAQLALSHTASLGSKDAVVNAFLGHCGVARVDTLPVLLETLKLLHVTGPLPGRNMASMSCSGGEAALMADTILDKQLQFRPLTSDDTSRIAATLPSLVTVSNPFDYHTFSWKNRPALTATFAAMMEAHFDLTLLILDYPRADRCDDTDWTISALAFQDAAAHTGTRGAIVASLPESMPLAHARALMDAGIVPLCGLEEALSAIEAAANAGDFARRTTPATRAAPSMRHGGSCVLAEWEGKQFLAQFGVSVPRFCLATSIDAATIVAQEIGFPIALKATGRNLAHKTELGAVKLGLNTTQQTRDAAKDLLTHTGTLLVEEMITDVVAELIVGVSMTDGFGLCLVLGSGGILVELINDSQHLLIPASREDIATAMSRLKIAQLCHGYRGKPPGDMEAAIDAVLAIQAYAVAHAAVLIELDVNPLMIRTAGNGAVAADVLINLAEEIHT